MTKSNTWRVYIDDGYYEFYYNYSQDNSTDPSKSTITVSSAVVTRTNLTDAYAVTLHVCVADKDIGTVSFNKAGTYTVGKSLSVARDHSAKTGRMYGYLVGNSSGKTYWTSGQGFDYQDLTIPAKPSYTVAYAANGGTTTPSSQTKWYNETLTLAAGISHANASAGTRTVTLDGNGSGTVATRTSTGTTKYTFNKWKAASGTAYAAKGSYTTNAATTMTAQWATSTTWTSVSLGAPSRSGFTFVRWNSAANNTGAASYAASASMTPSASTTLYAIWNRTVSYDANGGGGAPASQTALATSAIKLSATAPTRPGYAFAGWNTASDGSGTAYAKGGTYAAQQPSATLYAQWEKAVATSVTDARAVRVDPFAAVEPGDGDDPAALGWYEKDSYGEAFATDDAEVDSSKEYYEWDWTAARTEADEGTVAWLAVDVSATGAASAALTLAVTPPEGLSVVASSPAGLAAAKAEGTALAATFECWARACPLDSQLEFGASVSTANTSSGTSQAVPDVIRTLVLPTAFFTMDVLAGGKGVSFGGPATETGFFSHMRTFVKQVLRLVRPTSDATAANALEIEDDGYRSMSVGWDGAIETSSGLNASGDVSAGNNLYGLHAILGNGTSDAALKAHTTNRTANVIQVHGDPDGDSGDAVVIGDGGLTVIGSGESHNNLYSAWIAAGVSPSDERMAIASDGTIYFETNCNTIANRRECYIDTTGYYNTRAHQITKGTAPSSDTAGTGLLMKDSANNLVGALRSMFTSSAEGVQLYAVREVSSANKYNILYMGVDSSGSAVVKFSGTNAQGAWRDALGWSSEVYSASQSRTANTVLAAPNGSAGAASFRKLVAADLPTVTVAKGGTGQTGVSSVTTVSSVITAASGMTIKSATYKYWGKLAMLEVVLTHTAAWTNGTQYNVGTVVSGKRPAVNAGGNSNASSLATLTTAGVLYVRPISNENIAAGGQIQARLTYLLP